MAKAQELDDPRNKEWVGLDVRFTLKSSAGASLMLEGKVGDVLRGDKGELVSLWVTTKGLFKTEIVEIKPGDIHRDRIYPEKF